MTPPPNEWYLQGLRAQTHEVLRHIFATYLPQAMGVLRNMGAQHHDVEDAFMYSIEVLYRKVQEGDLVLTVTFGTFLIDICKKKYLKDQRRNKHSAGVTTEDVVVLNTVISDDLPMEKTEQYRLMMEKFKELRPECQAVLHLSWHTDLSMEDLAEQMGWTYGAARKRKSECKKQLTNSIRSDARYTDLRFN
jgi:RNA polymerase sigma factor (sigma-70 family)